jgi:hypothetical protein
VILIANIIVSRELFDNHFTCHLEKCSGNCCVYGDAGAPLEEQETDLLERNLETIKSFMRPEGIRAVREQGCWVVDRDGESVTPLVGNEECAFAFFEDGIARCSIEKTYEAGRIAFQKPVSCHLYPIRVTPLNDTVALNYHRWSICEPARILGKLKGVPVFRFLKDPLIRIYGAQFFDELEKVYIELHPDSEKELLHP